MNHSGHAGLVQVGKFLFSITVLFSGGYGLIFLLGCPLSIWYKVWYNATSQWTISGGTIDNIKFFNQMESQHDETI